MGRSIVTEEQIDAPPEQVWRALVDFPSYPSWNPFIISCNVPSGEFAAGQALHLTIRPPGQGASKFKAKLLVVDPGHELRWRGSLPIPGLFVGTHYFKLEPLQGGKATKLVHGEDFSGLLVGLLGGTLTAAEQGFKEMNTVLKKRAEAGSTTAFTP